jgi:hypothetical protein
MADVFHFKIFQFERRPIDRHIRDRLNPLEEYSDSECFQRYRFNKDGIVYILDCIIFDLENISLRGFAIPPVIKLCFALCYYANGEYYRLLGDGDTVSKSTVCRVIYKVTKSIVRNMRDQICFPRNEELTNTQVAFFDKYGIPGVSGLIDGTHIRIVAPHDYVESYVNRKGYHSINSQVTVDADGLVTSVTSR